VVEHELDEIADDHAAVLLHRDHAVAVVVANLRPQLRALDVGAGDRSDEVHAGCVPLFARARFALHRVRLARPRRPAANSPRVASRSAGAAARANGRSSAATAYVTRVPSSVRASRQSSAIRAISGDVVPTIVNAQRAPRSHTSMRSRNPPNSTRSTSRSAPTPLVAPVRHTERRISGSHSDG